MQKRGAIKYITIKLNKGHVMKSLNFITKVGEIVENL